MSQWGFYFNQDRCLGCLACKMACKNWNEKRRGDTALNKNVYTYSGEEYKSKEDGGKYGVAEGAAESSLIYMAKDGSQNYDEFRKYYMKENWRRVETHEYGASNLDNMTNTFRTSVDRRYLSISCNHCTEPMCVKACPIGNIQKDNATGAVLPVNYEACQSCGRCKEACPWSAPQFYDDGFAKYAYSDPNRPRMTKCTLCKDRISEGLKPACVAACWNRALDAGPIDDLRLKYAGAQISESLPEFKSGKTEFGDTLPNIIFKQKSERIKMKP